MCVTTSPQAYRFARSFGTEFSSPKEQKVVPELERHPPKADDDIPKSLNRRIGATDYGKWESIAREVSREEQLGATDAEKMRNMASPCAHDRSKERALYEKSAADKIEAAERFRAEGNFNFRNDQIEGAALFYKKALLQLDYTFTDDESELRRLDAVKLATHLNLAAAKLKLREFDDVLIQTRLALQIDPACCKAFYRRGLVHLERAEYEEAQVELQKAAELEPTDRSIVAAIQLLDRKTERTKVRDKVVFRAMFQPEESPAEEEEEIEGAEVTSSSDEAKSEDYCSPPSECAREEAAELRDASRPVRLGGSWGVPRALGWILVGALGAVALRSVFSI
eukprot:Polyplicarium_translucidae@DN891_c0_g1_i1.p1